jgi:hypothetical protein
VFVIRHSKKLMLLLCARIMCILYVSFHYAVSCKFNITFQFQTYIFLLVFPFTLRDGSRLGKDDRGHEIPYLLA